MTDLHQRTVRNRAADMTQGDVQLPDDPKFWIANVEGVILPQYSAIGLGSLLTFPDQYSDFTTRMCFVTTPLVRNRPFAIIQKTLHANEFYVATDAIAAGGTQPPATDWVRLIGDADVYDSTAHYAIGEQVTSGGTAYAAIQPVDGEAVSDTSYWVPLGPRRGMWDGGKVGIAGPPVKTKKGWLLLYHGVSWSTTYRVGAVLLDLNDPTLVLARTAIPLFEPEEEYERKGLIANVVFPCSLVVRKGIAYIYYGAADSVVGAASIKLDQLLRMLEV